jgi:hypothetical protein
LGEGNKFIQIKGQVTIKEEIITTKKKGKYGGHISKSFQNHCPRKVQICMKAF